LNEAIAPDDKGPVKLSQLDDGIVDIGICNSSAGFVVTLKGIGDKLFGILNSNFKKVIFSTT
jgi:hypothetical protein